MEWIEKYPKKSKPVYDDLLAFMPEKIRELFLRFDREISQAYGVSNNYPRFEKTTGWAYGYCRAYRIELLCVTIGSDYFSTLGVKIEDEESLNDALEKAKLKYDEGYEERYARQTAARKANQSERTKKRLEREKAEIAKMTENIDPAKFNKCKWSEKVSRTK